MATSTDLRAAIEEVQESVSAEEQFDAEGLEGAYEPDWARRVERRVGALPWWVISAVIHSVIFLLATLLTVALPSPKTDEVVITSDVAEKKKPEFEKIEKRDIFTNTHEVQADTSVDRPVVVHEKVEDTTHFETANEVESNTSRGQEDAISDIPLGGTGVTGSMGVGGGGMAGVFGYRGAGGRKRAVARFGGSKKTESSVDAALAWLVRHQELDGHWDAGKWKAKPGGSNARVNTAMTGMALLAFLGAGHTEKAGKYRDNVRRAENWLVKRQQAVGGGRFDRRGNYTQGIVTLAVAEAYGMTKNPKLLKPAQAAVDAILEAQGPYEGWNYGPKSAAGRNDTSVTGWNLMALKSAKIAGLKVDNVGFQGCMRWLDVATNRKNGRCAYAGYVNKVNPGAGSTAMWSAGMLMRQFMGVKRGDPILKAAAESISKHQPKWGAGGAGVNLYYWYYGTLCMFQMGGEHWKEWNKNMKGVLLTNQRKGGPRDGSADDVDGSWDDVGGGGIPTGGRVFSTSLGALCLEVYYRYLPMYTK